MNNDYDKNMFTDFDEQFHEMPYSRLLKIHQPLLVQKLHEITRPYSSLQPTKNESERRANLMNKIKEFNIHAEEIQRQKNRIQRERKRLHKDRPIDIEELIKNQLKEFHFEEENNQKK